VTDFRQAHPDGVILAVDQMSAYLQASLTRVWSCVGHTPSVRVSPQRECVHFYGALDVLHGQQVALPAPHLNGEYTVHFLEHILACFPNQPLLLLWDRAPWHKGVARQFVQDHPRLDMLFFPPGSPHLNPQEHVWKHVRQAVGHLRDYAHISQLRHAFLAVLDTTLFHFNWIAKYLPPTLYASAFP
jgi:transposase